MRIYIHRESKYWLLFDEKYGKQYRIGFTDEPYFSCEGPELLDISITNYCEKKCSFCYRKSSEKGKHMPIKLYEKILKQASECGVLQIALGGGNPNQHPQFSEILCLTRKYGIVPTYTTNGYGMTEEIYMSTKKYCGAMAVSFYDPLDNLQKVVRKCKEYGIKLNIHFVLDRKSIETAIKLLTNPPLWIKEVNAIIFLNYKPVNGDIENCLNMSDKLELFWEAIMQFNSCKIGFDSCMISFVKNIVDKICVESIDFCEAARFSAFINEEGIMYPCSFMNDLEYVLGQSLASDTLRNIWINGTDFVECRKMLLHKENKNCLDCGWFKECHGGCRTFPINKCYR